MNRRDEAYRQQPGFDYEAGTRLGLARTTDKPTSHKAATGIVPKIGTLHVTFLKTIGRRRATANEVACLAAMADPRINRESLRKRAPELVRRNLLAEDGTKVCDITKKEATAYRKVGGEL